jgi:enoyl-CoA hydratase
VAAVEVERDGHVLMATLNRPDVKNTINPEMLVRLARLWDQIAADRDVRAVVLTGAAGSTFCAGADLGRLATLLTGARPPEDEWDHAVTDDLSLLGRALLTGVDLGKPLVVAANGHAVAGGMVLLFAGDIRVMATGGRMACTEAKLGLMAGGGATALLARELPPAIAREVLVTGEPLSAERAYEVGFVNHLADPGDVLSRATEIAATIAANAPLAVGAIRDVTRTAAEMNEADALAYEHRRIEELLATEDCKEGPLAFMEKRTPVFQGR